MSKRSESVGLSSRLVVGSHAVRNRIVLPPMVLQSPHALRKQGQPDPATIDRYVSVARGGTGLVVVEATAVLAEGRGWDGMLGLWSDAQIKPFEPLAAGCRNEGAVILVQLQHHGVHTNPLLGEPVSASRYVSGIVQARAMSRQEVRFIRDAYVGAAARAFKAGFDGVELHACHGYLLNQFLDGAVNHRTDEYGGAGHGRALLTLEIIAGIRQKCPPGFIISVRTAGECPSLTDGIQAACEFESAGADMLSVSSGIGAPSLPPPGFPFSPTCRLGCEIKKHVGVPVAAVGGLSRPGNAARLIAEGYADLAAVGRGHLIHPNWAARALGGYPVSHCLECPKCAWYTRDPENCPAFLQAKPIRNRD